MLLVRKDVQEFVMAEEERIKFIRQRPLWYRQLTRHPDKLSSFELDKMNFFEKTIPHRVSQLSNSVQMAEMMIQMFQAMRNQNGAG
nr:YlbE-like family protein [Bacillus pumilus]